MTPGSEPTEGRALPGSDYDEQWARLADFLRYNPGARHRRRLIDRALRRAGFVDGSLLDVGCGLGELVRFLEARYPRASFTGVDLSEFAIERCRESMPGHDWACADIVREPLDRQFDALVCSEVLEHLDDPARAVHNLGAMLVPGGHVVVTVPAGKIHATERSVGHLHHPALVEVHTWLRSAGLEVVTSQAWGWPGYTALKYAANLRPEATVKSFGDGDYTRGKRWFNDVAYLGTGLLSFPTSRWGVQLVVVGRRRAA